MEQDPFLFSNPPSSQTQEEIQGEFSKLEGAVFVGKMEWHNENEITCPKSEKASLHK